VIGPTKRESKGVKRIEEWNWRWNGEEGEQGPETRWTSKGRRRNMCHGSMVPRHLIEAGKGAKRPLERKPRKLTSGGTPTR